MQLSIQDSTRGHSPSSNLLQEAGAGQARRVLKDLPG